MNFLDYLIFGNGRGLSAPCSDQRFYWLVDAVTKRGRLYNWSGWFGAQLASFQWTRPLAGETRILCGRTFTALHSQRSWVRVRVAWSAHLSDDIDKANADLRLLQDRLGLGQYYD